MRYQSFNDFQDATTGEVFASQGFFTDTRLYAKMGTAYTAPAAVDYDYGSTPGNLKPEQSVSWEFGVKQKLFKESSPLELGAVYFHNDLRDLIQYNPVTFNAYNIAGARTQGVELTLDWRPVKEIRFFANGTILDARALTDDPAGTGITAGSPLLLRPDYSTTFGVEVSPVETITMGISGTA